MDGEGEYSKEKGKIRQGAIATGLQVPRDGQAGLTNKKKEMEAWDVDCAERKTIPGKKSKT